MSKKNIPLAQGTIIEINISGVSHQGQGIGRYQDFAVFVNGALPGETVRVLIEKVNKNYAEAGLLEVLDESAERVIPQCHIAAICGGCHLQHTSYKEQLRIKRLIVENALKRIGKFEDFDVLPVIGMEEPWRYRNRLQLHFQFIDGMVKAGFYREETNRLIAVDNCYLVPDIFNRIFDHIVKELNILIRDQEGFDKTGLSHLVMRMSRKSGEIALIFIVRDNDDGTIQRLADDLVKAYPQIVSVVKNNDPRKKGSIFGRKWQYLRGKKKLQDEIAGNLFLISPPSFTQVNPEQTEILYGKVWEFAQIKKGETAIDVYSGIGTISLFFARYCHKVYGIEEVAQATADAKENAALNGIENTEFLTGKAEERLPQMEKQGIKADLVVVDPPRKGCDPKVLAAIAAIGPARIVYVSCDPSTLARDLRILCDLGYDLRKVQPVDMFPQTRHVETVVLMSRVNR